MRLRFFATIWAWCALVLTCLPAAGAGAGSDQEAPEPAGTKPKDNLLAAARRYVDASDRYLHHDRLRRGMKGYGLTVMAGTQIVRFDVEIVSVMKNWGPHQDIILARLTGKDLDGVNLADAGIISGMSGSPVYVRDPQENAPRGGKDKLIGAVAYGWFAQTAADGAGPQCGIQPITQMVAASGILGESGRGDTESAPKAAADAAPQAYLRTVLDPRKLDFSRLGRPMRAAAPSGLTAGPRLAPLTTPVMVAGMRPATIERAARVLSPLGMVPVQAGGVAAVERAAQDIRLVPGSAIGIPLVTGDAEWSAVGTVTDVIDLPGGERRVLALGHSFYAEGDVSFPMGPAYVHTVVSRTLGSFKLGATLDVTGELTRDAQVGVAGRAGVRPGMVPMTVTVRRGPRKGMPARTERFEYQVARHRWMTATMARMLIQDASWAWAELPEDHTVTYRIAVGFGKLGTYRSANTTSGTNVASVTSDVSRPLAALLNNPLGPAPVVERIDVEMSVEPVNRRGQILELKLAGEVYKPGETVTGAAVVREYRKPRRRIPFRLKLPGDLPDGEYTVTVSDAETWLMAMESQRPHDYEAWTVSQLFAGLQRVVEPAADVLYVRLPLPGRGVAIRTRELPDLPESRAGILSQAAAMDARTFGRSVTARVKTEFVPVGSAQATLAVRAVPAQLRIHTTSDQKGSSE